MIHVNLIQRVLHRLAFSLPGGHTLRQALHRARGVKIGQRVWISRHVYIDELHPEAVTIGDNATIGLRTSIITHLYWGPARGPECAGRVTICDDVFVGPHCVILPNVTIGSGAVIQAGTVVSKDVPPNTLWGLPLAGPLAEVTVPLTADHSYKEFVWGLRPLPGRKPAAAPARTTRDASCS